MNTTNTVKNLLILLLFIICPFIYGQLVYFIKLHMEVYQREYLYFYFGNYTFFFTCMISGIFLFSMVHLYHIIIDLNKYGNIIGLLCTSIIPVIWLVIILIESRPEINYPLCNFLLSSMKFLFFDNDVLSTYLILLTIIMIFNLIPKPQKKF